MTAPVCDFCGRSDVRWSYPVKRTAGAGMLAINPKTGERVILGMQSSTPWAACDGCHDLIETGDKSGLLDRALGHVPSYVRAPATLKPALKAGMGQAHAAFFAQVSGDPTSYNPEEEPTC